MVQFNENHKNIMRKSIEYYGQTSQINQTVEEISELIIELVRNTRPNRFCLDNVAEEMADVHIMLWQIEEMYQLSDLIEQKIDEKMDKL